jgi:hypothetical protein
MGWRYGTTFLDLHARLRGIISFRPLPLYPKGRATGTHCMRGWVGTEPVWTLFIRQKLLAPAWYLNSAVSACSPSPYQLS